MHDRTLLGPADVTDDELAGMVARLLGRGARLGGAADLAGGGGAVRHPGDHDRRSALGVGDGAHAGPAPRRTGCSSSRCSRGAARRSSPRSPASYQEMAAASVPWRTEGLAYASDLGDRLPEGLSMPRSLGVHDLDELSTAIWLEAVDRPAVEWDLERYRRAAYLLGRMAASPRWRRSPTSAPSTGRCAPTCTGAWTCRCCRCCATTRSGSTRRSPSLRRRPARPAAGGGAPGGRVAGGARPDAPDDHPRRLQPEQPAPGPDPGRLHPDRLRLLDAEPDRLRPRPAAGRRRAARPPLAVAPRGDRGGDRPGVRRGDGRRGHWSWTRPPCGARTPCC